MLSTALCNLFGRSRHAATTIDGYHPKDPGLVKLFRLGQDSIAGVRVDEDRAKALPALWRGLNILGNGVARAPFDVYRLEDGDDGQNEVGRTIDKDHPSRPFVRRFGRPNHQMRMRTFRKTLTCWSVLWGNGCAFIDRDEAARVRSLKTGGLGLVPLLPDRTGIMRLKGGGVDLNPLADGQLMYWTIINGKTYKFLPENILHIKGLSNDGLWGIKVVDQLREAIGGAIAVKQHGYRFFKNGAHIAGFVNTAPLSEEAMVRFQESLEKATVGSAKAFKVVALEGDTKFTPMTMSMADAQFLAKNEFDLLELAHVLGVQHSKLADSKKQSFNSLEQANQNHKDDDLLPLMDDWSEEMSCKLLTEEEQDTPTHEVTYDDSEMQWVPFRDRVEGATKAHNNHLLDQDEARDLINFAPARKNPNRKRFMRPQNITFATDPNGQPVEMNTGNNPKPPKQPPAAPPPGKGNRKSDADYQQLLELSTNELTRIVTRIGKQARAKANLAMVENKTAIYCDWLDELSTEQGPAAIRYASTLMVATMKGQLDKCAEEAKPLDQLGRLVNAAVDSWDAAFIAESLETAEAMGP